MKSSAKFLLAALAAFLVIQFVRPSIPSAPPQAEAQYPPDVARILQKSCYSCHSNERRLAWFDEVAPAYWLVRHDVLTARQHLNFSTLGARPAAAQRSALFEAVNMIQLGAMPLPQFTALHPQAKITSADLDALKAYLAPWKTLPPASDTLHADSQPAAPALSLSSVAPALNGIPFDPSFLNWKPLSFSDRGDNNTFRFVLGNDVAVRAAQSGAISPWPDGARFAKVAWQQALGPDRLIHSGKFVQVELMIKDASQFKDTDGWGWARWVGADLKPYGKDAHFVNECTGCHQPVRGDDYVYTLPFTPAHIENAEAVNNNAAALPTGLPFQTLAWQAITMFVDPNTRSIAALYGNASAIEAIRSRRASGYPAGAVLALVTWAERDDPHWFGARIPDRVASIEFVQISAAGEQPLYRRFTASGEEHALPSLAAQRTSFIQGLSPSQLP